MAQRYKTKYKGVELTYKAVTDYQLNGPTQNETNAGASIDEVEEMVNNNFLQASHLQLTFDRTITVHFSLYIGHTLLWKHGCC